MDKRLRADRAGGASAQGASPGGVQSAALRATRVVAVSAARGVHSGRVLRSSVVRLIVHVRFLRRVSKANDLCVCLKGQR